MIQMRNQSNWNEMSKIVKICIQKQKFFHFFSARLLSKSQNVSQIWVTNDPRVQENQSN